MLLVEDDETCCGSSEPFVHNPTSYKGLNCLLRSAVSQLVECPGFESSEIFNLHIFASGIFGYLLNEKTTCIFNVYSLMNRNSSVAWKSRSIFNSFIHFLTVFTLADTPFGDAILGFFSPPDLLLYCKTPRFFSKTYPLEFEISTTN